MCTSLVLKPYQPSSTMFNLYGKQIILTFFIFIRTDRRENKVGTVGPIAEANMRDFERKK